MINFLSALYGSFVVFSLMFCFDTGYPLPSVVVMFLMQAIPFAIGVMVGRGER